MELSDFRIGGNFRFNDRLMRCTDVGTRAIVAIYIDYLVVETRQVSEIEGEGLRRNLTGREAEEEGWFRGPPYAVVERVLDEYDQEVCKPV